MIGCDYLVKNRCLALCALCCSGGRFGAFLSRVLRYIQLGKFFQDVYSSVYFLGKFFLLIGE